MNRDDHKQRWIQRQHEEEPRYHLETYQIKHKTKFSEYVAVVEMDRLKQHVEIYLYDGEPATFWLFRLHRIDHDPVRFSEGNERTLIHETIVKMITDYELMLHEKERAEKIANESYFLDIDHEAELERRRKKIARTEPEIEVTTESHERTIDDYFDTMPEQTEEERFMEEIKETARKTGQSEESLKNLKQNKNKILQFQKKNNRMSS